MTEHATLVRVTAFTPAPGRRAELVGRLQQLAVVFRQHDGCYGTQVCIPDGHLDAVAVLSRWRDQAALDALLRSDAASGITELAPLIGRPPTTHHFHSIPQPHPAAKTH